MALLAEYFRSTFPSDVVWGLYDGNTECAFEYKDNKFQRFLRFATHDAFAKSVKIKAPHKVHVGATYVAGTRRIVSSHFVIDIDLSDSPWRPCCTSKKTCCRLCWPLAVCAVRVLEEALELACPGSPRMVVWSGRRGFHLWVKSRRLERLGDVGRRQFAQWLAAFSGKDSVEIPVLLHTDGLIQKVLPHCMECMRCMCASPMDGGAGFFDDRGRLQFAEMVRGGQRPLEQIWAAALEGCDALEASPVAWAATEAAIREGHALWLHFVAAVLHLTWPRLDTNVTAQAGHLVKVRAAPLFYSDGWF